MWVFGISSHVLVYFFLLGLLCNKLMLKGKKKLKIKYKRKDLVWKRKNNNP